jgi:hypothetical protein
LGYEELKMEEVLVLLKNSNYRRADSIAEIKKLHEEASKKYERDIYEYDGILLKKN